MLRFRACSQSNRRARINQLVHAQGSTQLAAYNWTFDAAGWITQFLHTDYTDTVAWPAV